MWVFTFSFVWVYADDIQIGNFAPPVRERRTIDCHRPSRGHKVRNRPSPSMLYQKGDRRTDEKTSPTTETSPTKPSTSSPSSGEAIEIWRAMGNERKKITGVKISKDKKRINIGWNDEIYEDGKEKALVGVDSIKVEWLPSYYKGKHIPPGRQLIRSVGDKDNPDILFMGILHGDKATGYANRTDWEDVAFILAITSPGDSIYYEEFPEGERTDQGYMLPGKKFPERNVSDPNIPSLLQSADLLRARGRRVFGLEPLQQQYLRESSIIKANLWMLNYLERAGGNPVRMAARNMERLTEPTRNVDAISWFQNRATQIHEKRESVWAHRLWSKSGIALVGDGHLRNILNLEKSLYSEIETRDKYENRVTSYRTYGLNRNLHDTYSQYRDLFGCFPNFGEHSWKYVDHYRNFYDLQNGPDPFLFESYPSVRNVALNGDSFDFPHPKNYTPEEFYKFRQEFRSQALPVYEKYFDDQGNAFMREVYLFYHLALKDKKVISKDDLYSASWDAYLKRKPIEDRLRHY